MSNNKYDLIVALESADNEMREIRIEFAIYNKVTIGIMIIPEITISDDIIEIYDQNMGVTCRLSIDLVDSVVNYDETEDMYEIKISDDCMVSIFLNE